MSCVVTVLSSLTTAEQPIIGPTLQLAYLEAADDHWFTTCLARTLLCAFQDGGLAWRAPSTLVTARLNGLGSFVSARQTCRATT